MGLFGGSKSSNDTNATDYSATSSAQELALSVGRSGQGATAKDNAISTTGSRNTIDQSDNTGSLLQNGKVGNNSNISLTTVTTATDYGAVEGAFATVSDALAANYLTTNAALATAGTASLASAEAAAAAVEAQQATAAASIEAQKSTASDALASNYFTANAAFATVGDANRASLEANYLTTSAALGVVSGATQNAIDAVNESHRAALDFAGDNTAETIDALRTALSYQHSTTLSTINAAKAQSADSIGTAERLIESTTEKFAENKSPGLTENKWVVGGAAAVLGIGLLILANK
ncbi:hypothetical protein [Geminisphaera colitermitum]|uniref:hypothetical protein n=1 Tax=Geminisphaera colitermitum TaxID=1148786 RepID=UPI000158D363|nr:hypothetical protein [Geminisphaera colitermitum]